MNHYQLLVIGAGPGGYTAALQAAKLGLRTAIVERREVGGTCLNRGCIPTKALLHAAQIYHEAQSGGEAGILAQDLRLDLPAMFAHQRKITETLRSGVEGLLRNAKVELIPGSAAITAPNTVQVERDGERRTFTAERILIATGSEPAMPPIPGLELAMTSDQILQGMDRPYRSIVIIGGGVIGVEFASFFRQLGCQVTILEGLDRLLPNLDRELGQNLAQLFKKQGLNVYTNAMVQAVEPGQDGLTVRFQGKTGPGAATAEKVLCAIGRRPAWAGLFPGDLQPETEGRRIRVDSRFATSIPGVYAIGDVSSTIQLAHVAAAQGTACVNLMCGKPVGMDLSIVPSCIYCRPEIASVGLTEAQAKAAGIPAKTGKCTLFSNARTMIANPGRSFIKLVAHSETHEMLGAQLMCEHSTDMISQISLAMANHLTAQQLLLAMRPHPTFEEAMADALEELIRKLG